MFERFTESPFVVRFARYSVVSFFAFVLDLEVIYLCVQDLHAYYLFAVVAGFAAEIVAKFFLNRRWTYESKASSWRMGYSGLVGITTLLLILGIEFVEVQYFQMEYLMARIVAGGFATVWSYVGDSYLTFQVSPFGPELRKTLKHIRASVH